MTPSLRLVDTPAPADLPAPHDIPAPAGPRPVPPPPVPPRPRLRRDRALAWRSPTSVQVGSSRTAALVVDGLDPAAAGLVRGLDGSRRGEDLLAEAVARGGDAVALRALLDRLLAAGVLAGAAPSEPRLAGEVAGLSGPTGLTGLTGPTGVAGVAGPPPDGDRLLAPRREATVLVHGGGRTAVAVACLLATAGVGTVVPRGAGVVAGCETGTGLLPSDVGRPRAEAVTDAVLRAAPATRTAAPVRRRPDLVVLGGGEVVDPALARRLVAAGRPHLPVAVREGLGLVGPLVLPGRTACLWCLEGRRAAGDPAWPRVAAQLVGWEAPAPVAVATATAAVAVEQVLAVLDAPATAPGSPAAPPALGAVLEVDPRRARLHRRPAPPRAACGCAVGTPRGECAA